MDLIDVKKRRRKNEHGVMMSYIVSIKDHFSRFTYVEPIPRKRARFVAHVLERFFGLFGCPKILHTDNGKEFTAREILELVHSLSPNLTTVTGRPRTPRDQGSVEAANKTIKRVLWSVEREQREAQTTVNWCLAMGRVNSSLNSTFGHEKQDVAPYSVVFGREYHDTEMADPNVKKGCRTVEETLDAVPSSHFAKVASQHCEVRSVPVVEVLEEPRDYWSRSSSVVSDLKDDSSDWELSDLETETRPNHPEEKVKVPLDVSIDTPSEDDPVPVPDQIDITRIPKHTLKRKRKLFSNTADSITTSTVPSLRVSVRPPKRTKVAANDSDSSSVLVVPRAGNPTNPNEKYWVTYNEALQIGLGEEHPSKEHNDTFTWIHASLHCDKCIHTVSKNLSL
ncbi:MAG: integrase catalytic domain-containing protein, partial [Cetobacterium sp.]